MYILEEDVIFLLSYSFIWAVLLLFLGLGLWTLRGVWFVGFFIVLLRPLQDREETPSYFLVSFVGVLSCLKTWSLAVYFCTLTVLLCRSLSFLLCFCTRGCTGVFVSLRGFWVDVLLGLMDTCAVQFSLPYWKQMLFLMRKCMNSALWSSVRLAN